MKQFWAGLLVAAGILIMTTSGLCSAYVIISGLQAAFQMQDGPWPVLAYLWVPIITGGLPMLFGWVLYSNGQRLLARLKDDA